jgi:response regulator NasT
VLRRFAEYHDLEGAFGRRAVTEAAKGIPDGSAMTSTIAVAFNMLRDEARSTNSKIIDVAEAVVRSRSMLPAGTGRPRNLER